jgi:hypothetical protein
MRLRAATISTAVAIACLLPVSGGAAPAQAATICTWGGTAAAPTGTFSLKSGLTNVPAPGPIDFRATGQLAGGGICAGTLTFDGQVNAGSTCPVTFFEGTVKGLPGVVRFWGDGAVGVVPELLYDSVGNLVGSDQPQVLTADNAPHFTDCTTPTGFTGGTFSSVVELF